MSRLPGDSAYERAGFGGSLPRGTRPAVIVVDLIYGFTDPSFPLAGVLDNEIRETRLLLDVAREAEVPIYFTTIAYEPGAEDCGLWLKKGPALAQLERGSRWSEVDARLGRLENELLIVKKGASAFFGTNLAAVLVSNKVDTVVLCGATTSGCVRASAVDLMQLGWPTLVPQECVGDRSQAAHDASLVDLHAKYVDVVTAQDACDYLARASTAQRVEA